MSSTFSALKFELITTGEQSGSWGTTTNTNIGTAIEQAVVGMATLTSANFTSNVATLTLTNTNTAQNARALCLNIDAGAVSAAGTINVPAIQKPYLIINGSSFTVTVKVTGLTGVAVPAGKRTVVYNNGTDVGNQIDYLATLALGTALPVTSGGTGVTTSTGTGNVVLSTSPTLVTPLLGTPTSVTLTNATGLPLTTGITGTLPVANGGTGTVTPSIVAGTNVTVSGTWPNQTINSSNTGGTVTSVSGTAPVSVATGTTTPVISMAAATTSVNGYLTSTDWTTFNNKAPTASPAFTGTPTVPTAANGTNTTQAASTAFVINQIGAISAGVTTFSAGTTGLTPSAASSGAVTLAGTLAVANGGTGTASPSLVAGTNVTISGTWPNQTINATGGGTVTSVTGTAPVVSSGGTTPAISMAAATTSVSGYLTSTDWNTFNNKQAAGSYVTVGGALGTPSSGTLTNCTFPTLNQNTTGTAAGLSATLAVASGGTGVTSSTGSGSVVLSTSPSLTTPALGTPSSGNLANCTFPTLNQNTTGSSGSCTGNAATATNATNATTATNLSGGTVAATTITATGDITAFFVSDIKFKENIRVIPDALAKVNAIGGKLYDWTDEYIANRGGADGYFVSKEDFGVVAQDVLAVFPLAVRTRSDGSLAVDYIKLAALSFAALNELTKRIETLESKS